MTRGKKWLAAAALALAVYWIITSPHDAAATAHNAVSELAHVAESLTMFLTALGA